MSFSNIRKCGELGIWDKIKACYDPDGNLVMSGDLVKDRSGTIYQFVYSRIDETRSHVLHWVENEKGDIFPITDQDLWRVDS